MIRDPFNIHGRNALKANVFRAAQNVKEKAAQVGASALDMSFSIPNNVPNFAAPHRDLEDRAWAAVARRGASGGGILSDVQGKVAGYFEQDELPMYKDKPYGYAPSMRRRRWWRRKRVLSSIALGILGLLWLTGFFSHAKKRKSTSAWSWIGLSNERGKANWDERRQHVVEAFELSWDAYERYAWGYDEYHPFSKGGKNMAPKGLGWIIVDSLDTLILMNQTTRLHRAREWVSKSLTWDQDQDVNTFETTIRMLGGLLSAHYLSTEFPNMAPLKDDDPGMPGEDLYLEKARDLGDRLLAAFESQSGVPYASVNLAKYQGIPSHADMGASSTAEATSVQLEFKYLAKLTGEKHFWDKAEKVMEIIDDNNPKDGLVPIYIYATSGEFRGENIRLGSRGDSYYEYLIKQYLQTNKQEPVYEEMWKESLEGVRKHLITYTEPSGFTIIGERPEGLGGYLSPKMDHLVCFMPGTIALAATGGLTEAEARKLPTWGKKQEADMKLARELTQTCWGMYKFMATGLAAEITHFNIADPPLPESAHHDPPSTFDPDPQANWRNDFNVKSNDVHNLQRPETVESLFYMWRITKDERYREWGWEMFRSFMNYTAVEDGGGFTSLNNANVIPPVIKDNMESFWLAETLKYLYLLFSPDDVLPLDKMVLNTEAHPLPRFDMGGLFSTGWKRKPRGPDGKIIGGRTEAKPTSH
ncbi:mannosyl-oligosaccharide alpha-1,2-mannosidase [Purpureocillium lilacinum]|uniref:alpha-1,2-Mannosidase n=1 Tax=Purpureocillium lilacinum TaxID=33203 RepID=A0A179GWQ8_PURLI|nr:mannosyl-oligosaccharide 1,2-alpha-mannosidase [Purpureocillium lilacinum]GJN73287.1 mannosyl-oligosaccharide alpha-1,2-mannosidase [Purpureocillium lilacinum]GJN83800.1 mannosyl-oligosaccharide alpha-1,2-mannosidase [Purpureocillium lilacinum]